MSQGREGWRMELQNQIEVDQYFQQIICAQPKARSELVRLRNGGVSRLLKKRGNCYIIVNYNRSYKRKGQRVLRPRPSCQERVQKETALRMDRIERICEGHGR